MLDPLKVDDVKLEPIASKKIAHQLTNVTRPRHNGTPRRVGWSSGNGRSVGFTTWKRRSPRIRTLAPTAVACSGRNCAGWSRLALIARQDWFIPYVTPLAFHRISLKRKTRKLTCQRRRSLRTRIPTGLLPRPHRINRQPILCVDPHGRPDDGSRCFRWGRFDFDGERST